MELIKGQYIPGSVVRTPQFCVPPEPRSFRLTVDRKCVAKVAEKYAATPTDDLVALAQGRVAYTHTENLVNPTDRATAIAVLEGIR